MSARIEHAGSSRSHVPFSLRGGSVVALPTPFVNDRIDDEALAALCVRQVEAGTHGIVVCGTTGEAPALSHAEQQRVIEVAVEATKDKIPIIAGAGTSGTQASIALAQQAEEAGATALLCVVPYYVRPTQVGIYRHMRAIHDAVNIPLILYDVPARTGCALTDETIAALAQLERVVGLKDAAADVTRVTRLRSCVPDGFLMLSGDDATQAQHRRNGGDGCISVTANIAPAYCVAMHNAWDEGNPIQFQQMAEAMMPLNRAMFLEPNPIPVKYALSVMGLIRNELRLPLTPLAREHEAAVRAVVEQFKVTDVAKPPVAEASALIAQWSTRGGTAAVAM